MIDVAKKNLVVVGNGMVGYKFCEKLLDKGGLSQFNVTVFGEEPRPAYDRVQLTSYFSGKTISDLTLAPAEWYEQNGINLYVNDPIVRIDPLEKTIFSKSGQNISYDKLIFATGSYPFVPPLPGKDKKGVFVYRTIEDLDAIMAYAKNCKSAAVLGGGLLGLEAAKALVDLKLKTHVVECNPRLMPRQIDQTGSDVLQEKIKKLGVQVHLFCDTQEIIGNDSMEGLRFASGEILNVDMLVISVGIRPRDELAKQSGLAVGPRGGITVNAQLQTSNPDVYAIGECALFKDMTYGLVGPGYKMADIVAGHLLGENQSFNGADMSTKLKLLGVEVGSFGNPFAMGDDIAEVIVQSSKKVYKKLLIDRQKNILIGGVLVGDTTEYGQLLQMVQMQIALPDQPESLLIRSVQVKSDAGTVQAMPETAGICSCENVCKGRIVQAFHEGCQTVAKIKKTTKAGTVCGSCVPLISEIIDIEMKKGGHVVKKILCPCFDYTRVELAEVIRKEKYRNFWQVVGVHGKGRGCEICKPAIASILASYQHEYVMEHQNIQDTNDHFLANIQNNGSYSVVPRIAGGEIKPEQLIAIGEVAKEFNLYTKITGGQRIDLFGAKVEQLPLIWAKLRAVGLESGHAYAKALRTVKSCVGSTWCRYGVQDSVAMAIRIENRYKGLRAPHKIKSAVSGCARECAEAQSKDFGVIATEKGYNLFVCGNGGMKPQHAQLLAADLDDDTLIKYIDRFLMFYIRTADRLTRTAPWLNKLEGGLQRLKEIIIDDSLGIAEELEKEMQAHVDSYKCEWAATLDSPEKMKRFRPFVNSTETDSTIQFVPERGQKRPALREILKQREVSV